MRMPALETIALEDGDVVILYTDGVKSHFTLKEYPQMLRDDVKTIASTIVNSFGRAHDDAACVALKC